MSPIPTTAALALEALRSAYSLKQLRGNYSASGRIKTLSVIYQALEIIAGLDPDHHLNPDLLKAIYKILSPHHT